MYILSRFIFCLIFVSYCTIYATAGNFNFYGNARSAAMSNSVIMSPRLSFMQNQASLGWLNNKRFSLYSNFRPNLPQLSVFGAEGQVPLLKGGIGLQIQRFGYEVYNENKIALAYGKSLGDYFSAGIQFSYLYTDLSGAYLSYHSLVAEAGIHAQFEEKWFFGVHVYNPTLSKTGEFEDEVPETIIRAGAGVQINDNFFISAEAEKHIDKEINFRMGVDYAFEMGLNVQAGFQTYPRQFSIGAGYEFNKFAIQLAVTSNTYLEPGTHISLLYHF